ncbi:MAG: aryl-sulfate sulfotransferase [Myxococcota bacterium]|nr:aryl-sulfate sulfotransferase [Myxococcota bacterium]
MTCAAWLLATASCAEIPVETQISEAITTVVTVRWDPGAGDAERAWVRYGTDRDQMEDEAPAWPSEEGGYEALVWGLKPNTHYWLEPIAATGRGEIAAAATRIETGPAPTDLPDVERVATDPDAGDDGFLVTTVVFSPPSAVVLDRDGDYVWWHVLEGDVGTTRAYLSLDRREVILRHNLLDGEPRGLVRVSIDGADVEEIPLDNEHHDFVELPGGGFALLAQDVREVDGEEIIGDKIVELAPDGTQTDVWSAWDHLDVDTETGSDPQWGFSHANAIDHDPADDALFVSCRRLNTIFKVDRGTGDVLWQLGGKDSDFVLPDGGTTFFERQHQFHAWDDGIVVFDNGSFEQMQSLAVEYSLDPATGDAELVRKYSSDPPLYVYALGDASKLPSGNTLVSYSIAGQTDIVTPQGERIWRLKMALGGALGYATWVDSLYPE